jgi:DNA-binding transcriptional regulator YdaS (Cro superfamily)
MEKLIEYFKANRGMQLKLAKHLNLQPSTVSQWKNVPVEHLPEVSAFTGIPRQELVPHAFREPKEAAE